MTTPTTATVVGVTTELDTATWRRRTGLELAVLGIMTVLDWRSQARSGWRSWQRNGVRKTDVGKLPKLPTPPYTRLSSRTKMMVATHTCRRWRS